MMLSGCLKCVTFSCLPDGIMGVPHPGVLEACAGGKILILDVKADALSCKTLL